MGLDKQILKQLERDAKRLYEVLLEMLKAIRESIDILKKKKSGELKEAISAYISSYAHARGLRILLVTLHKSIQEDTEFERKLKEEEATLDQLIKQHKISVQQSLMQSLEFHQKWLKARIVETNKYQRINSRFSGMLMFYTYPPEKEEFQRNKQDFLRTLALLKRMGIRDIHYRVLACITEIIVIHRRIINFIGAKESHQKRVDNFLNHSVLPDFRMEVALLETAVIDKDLTEHSRKLKRHLQELEAMV